MKRVIIPIILAMLFVACSHQKQSSEQEKVQAGDEEIEWKEMDDFHMVMAESFHPFLDSGNLVPAKSLAEEMQMITKKWAFSSSPKEVNKEEIKVLLDSLNGHVTLYVELVRSGDDRKIGEALKDIHNRFHKIEELWYQH